MSAIMKFVEPAEMLFQPEAKPNRVPARCERRFPITVSESDRRFWKSVTPTSSAFAIVEMSILALFLVFGILGIFSCFGELSHLLQTDAVRHIATQAIAGR
jgi:hypothetical protein